MNSVLKIIIAVLVSEIILILLITFFQETIAGGVILGHSSLKNILIGGMGTLVSGCIAGIISSMISKDYRITSTIILSCLIVIETTYLIIADKIQNPFWFDVMAAISLIASVWIGLLIYQKYFKKEQSYF